MNEIFLCVCAAMVFYIFLCVNRKYLNNCFINCECLNESMGCISRTRKAGA